jgi:hypothetical protein
LGGKTKTFCIAHETTWLDLSNLFRRDLFPLYQIAGKLCSASRLLAAEDELYRRAVEGTLKPVFHKGIEVGHIRQYSDACLAMLLKAGNPDKYADRQQVEHKGVMLNLHVSGVREMG